MKTPIPIVNFTVNPSYTSIKEHNDDKLIEQIVEKGEQESTLEILTGKGLNVNPTYSYSAHRRSPFSLPRRMKRNTLHGITESITTYLLFYVYV